MISSPKRYERGLTLTVSAVDFEERLATFKSPVFESLRPSQKLVLDEFASTHLSSPDVAIEMPTGEGKTLVALLIADYALDQGWSVAYLTGTKQLAEKVVEEAEDLGLDVVRFSARNYGGDDLDDFHQAQAAGVMNYWVYFNSSPVPKPADLVIFDDAHLAEQPLSGLHTLRIPYADEEGKRLYRAICDRLLIFAERYPGLNAMRNGEAVPGAAPELITFADWANISSSVEALLAASPLVKEGELKHVWRNMIGRLARCGVLVGPDAIEIRPYHPATTVNPWYGNAKQRIYMSATLGSMDDLQRRLGVNPVVRLVPQSALPEGQTGTRQLLLNPTTESATEDRMIGWARDVSKAAGGRAAWLCASNSEADTVVAALSASGERVFRLKAGDDAALDRWVAAKVGHLVTAGRYDGLDFRGDICSLVVIVGVPQASSEFERFTAAYIGDASHMRHRVGQRLTQALGRANRVPSDRSLYLALDPKFAQLLADPGVRSSIPENARVYVRSALEIHGKGWSATAEAGRQFWAAGGLDTVGESKVPTASAEKRKRRPGRASPAVRVETAKDELAASTDLWIGSHETAAAAALRAASGLASAGELEHSAFWRYVQAHALYVSGVAGLRGQAQKILQEVADAGPRTAWFKRLASAATASTGAPVAINQNDRIFLAWDDWLAESGLSLEKTLSGARLELDGSHDEQCRALVVLAKLIGISGDLPPEKEQGASDCRWSWSAPARSERRVWEVKTGKAREVPRADVNQLLGQVEVEARRSPKSRVSGAMLTPTDLVSKESAEASRDKIALIHQPAALRLFDLLAERLREYFALCESGDALARGAARESVEARMPAPGQLERFFSPSGGRVRTVQDVEALFAVGAPA
ncbi:DEAD/DEAH box helicase family protein [Arthrobacter koreensis]|uniref:DEAD/DEAH box helicase family protein n=1 Tax=Arthrobacter koreensis TaxID=199136 RepID=UPI0036D7ECDA